MGQGDTLGGCHYTVEATNKQTDERTVMCTNWWRKLSNMIVGQSSLIQPTIATIQQAAVARLATS